MICINASNYKPFDLGKSLGTLTYPKNFNAILHITLTSSYSPHVYLGRNLKSDFINQIKPLVEIPAQIAIRK